MKEDITWGERWRQKLYVECEWNWSVVILFTGTALRLIVMADGVPPQML